MVFTNNVFLSYTETVRIIDFSSLISDSIDVSLTYLLFDEYL